MSTALRTGPTDNTDTVISTVRPKDVLFSSVISPTEETS